MATRTAPLVCRLIAVGLLTLFLCVGVVFVYVGWAPFAGQPSGSLTATGYVAMAIGLCAALVLGAGLAALILAGKREG